MLFPAEQDVTDSDLQLRLCVGDSADRPQTPHGSDSDEAKEPSPSRSPETLYLSRSGLEKVPENLLKNRALKHLYLEGNELRSLPESLFTSLPNLLWLDLRHNQLQSLPTEIGYHRCLRTLLLEGNPITELPPELGNVLSLRGLNLRDCPLSYPPHSVLQQGVLGILQYLRAALAQRPVSAPRSQSETPVVERLPLELMGSELEEEEEGATEEEELERFRELKLQMSLMEKAELERAAQPPKPPKPPKPRTLPALKRKKATRAGVTPLLLDAHVWNRSEERRQAALRELKEKEAMLEQRRKSQEALRKWWTQARTPQQAGHRQKKAGRQRQNEEAEPDTRPEAENSSDLAQRQAHSTIQYEESRAVQQLRQKINAIVQRIEERRRNTTEFNTDLIWEAECDVKEMRRLQAELLDMKRKSVFGFYSAKR